MPYAASHTAGTQVKVKISGSFVLIPGAQGFTNSPGEKPKVDTTPLNATARTHVAGTPDFGTWSSELAWDPGNAEHQYLLTSYNTTPSPLEEFQIVMTDAGVATVGFFGTVSQFGPSFDKDSYNKTTIRIDQSGALTVTP